MTNHERGKSDFTQQELFNFATERELDFFSMLTGTLGTVLAAEKTRKHLAKSDLIYQDANLYPELVNAYPLGSYGVSYPYYPAGFETNENTWGTGSKYPHIQVYPSLVSTNPAFDITLLLPGIIVSPKHREITLLANGTMQYNGQPGCDRHELRRARRIVAYANEHAKAAYYHPWSTQAKLMDQQEGTRRVLKSQDYHDASEVGGNNIYRLWFQHFRPQQK